MISIVVPERIRQHAREIAEPLEKLYATNACSIKSGAGHYYAKIGELLLCERYHWKHVDTYDYDCLAIDDDGTERRIEVKVKNRNHPPRGNYLATVAAANTAQKCTHYLFCSTIRDEMLYIVGILPKVDFLWSAALYRKGDPDPDSPPGQNWMFKADCFNLPYECLNQITQKERERVR
jgi:hypothetical protein